MNDGPDARTKSDTGSNKHVTVEGVLKAGQQAETVEIFANAFCRNFQPSKQISGKDLQCAIRSHLALHSTFANNFLTACFGFLLINHSTVNDEYNM